MNRVRVSIACAIGRTAVSAALVFAGAAAASAADAAATRDLQKLARAFPDATVHADRESGVATNVSRRDGWLAEAPIQAKAAVQDSDVVVRAFLDRYPALLGGSSRVLDAARVARDEHDGIAGMRTVQWQQELDGIPVHGALLSANLTARGDLIRIGSRLVPKLDATAAATRHTALAAAPPLDAPAALAIAAASIDATVVAGVVVRARTGDAEQHQRLAAPALAGDAYASLAWSARGGGLRLAWDLIVTVASSGRSEVLVDAQDGSVLMSRSLTTRSCFALPLVGAAAPAGNAAPAPVAPGPSGPANAAATIALRVYTSDSPSPFSPGWPSSNTAQPVVASRTLVTLASVDATASPNGWVDTNQTVGNNVDAHADGNADNAPDLPRPQGSGGPLSFDFPLDLTQDPATYRAAAITNLFYWCNVCHDRLYGLGFTEAAGNFQNDTFGRGGNGNDAVIADAQDGGDTAVAGNFNNANFSWAPDGTSGRMQMYLWTAPTPRRDGDLDATVIIHEYCHGLSNRLVGGGAGITQLQPSGMGEGWSDFYALSLLSDPADDVNGTYAEGSYVAAGLVSDNYYRGIRRYPYAIEPGATVTSASKNPLTLADISANSEVHKQGEVWCMALWEARGYLVQKLGGAVGNQTMLRLVTDGMKLSPADPTFLEARDAIIQADLAGNGGANLKQLWLGFAKRGMGLSATVPDSSTTAGVVEAFDRPGDLYVTSDKPFATGGQPGGPFAPAQGTFVVRNIDESPLTWSATKSAAWLTVSPSGGTLAPHASVTVTVGLTAAATALAVGGYHDTIAFANLTTGSGTTTRGVDVDVAYDYAMSATSYAWIDATSHAAVSLADDAASGAIALPFPFRFYGISYSSLYIGSNGTIGFGAAGMNDWRNTDLPDSDTPNALIAPLWDDLYPPQAGAQVSVGTSGSAPSRSFVITWTNVPQVNAMGQGFTFQALLREGSNDIVFQYQEVRPGLASWGAGLSATVGIESAAGVIARRYSFDGSAPLANGQAIIFRAPVVAAAAPVISPAPGAYTSPLAITISDATPGAVIRYTTDGSQPAPGNGSIYAGPFSVSIDTVVRASAAGTDLVSSGTAVAAYTITGPTPLSAPAGGDADANGRSGGSCGVGAGLASLVGLLLAAAARAAFTRPRASAAR